ncbi:MAG TPA: hypothetical protein VHO03_15750 [Ignavibacteriales bacterium]|nr:hypothetical protein [Ignavibacteriales bacterium]
MGKEIMCLNYIVFEFCSEDTDKHKMVILSGSDEIRIDIAWEKRIRSKCFEPN